MHTLSTTVHIRATTLRILADKLEECVIKENIEELVKMIMIISKVSSELVDISAGRAIQERRTHSH